MSLTDDMIAGLQAYADARTDIDFRAGWGATGRRAQIRGEVVDMGQSWDLDPNLAVGIFQAAAEVLGDWRSQDFDVVLAGGVTLDAEPTSHGSLLVHMAGALLRQDTNYSWTSGTTITFTAPVTGWVNVRYLAKRGV